MVLQGPSAPLVGAQSRTNSGFLGGQNSGMPLQNSFSMMVSSHNQFSSMNILGSSSSLLDQSYGNGGPNSDLSSHGHGIFDDGAESHSSSYISSPITTTANLSVQVSGQQRLLNPSASQVLMEQQVQQIDQQNFQHNQQQLHQFSVPNGSQQQQQQFQSSRSALRGVGSVKMEPNTSNEQLQALRNVPPVKLESHQMQNMRNLGHVKMEPQHSDPSLFLQQQKQQLLLSGQSPQAAAAAQMFHQQRLLQIQQQFLKAMPHQRSSLQQQFQSQSLPLRSPVKPVYEPGMCARRLTHYMYQQQHRPEDNNIEFWRKFVAEYFAPNAKKKWCVSMYGSGRQTNGVFPQDVWHCEICNRKPGRGFEATVEVLPRLLKIKYESGTIEELLYVDMPREYQNSSGQIVLDYAKAIQESVFEQLRVVRDGQLRIVFSPDLKICSWEFCAWRHDELIPRRLLIPQARQVRDAAQKYEAATQNSSITDQQKKCNMFVASADHITKALEVPLVNDLGYTKRYIRCLQISEVVNSMKDLIDYSRETSDGPVESLGKYPRRMNHNPSSSFVLHQQKTSHYIHQNSMNSRQENGVSGITIPPGSSRNVQQIQSPIPSPSNISCDANANDAQSSVQKIIHDLMMSSRPIGHSGTRDQGISSQQQGMMLSGLSNLNFDWKTMP